MKQYTAIACSVILLVLITGCTNLSSNPNNNLNNNPGNSQGQSGGRQATGQVAYRQRMNQTGFPKLDYEAAAAKLNISSSALQDALGAVPGQRPDFNSAAAKLNITIESLRSALGFSGNFTRGNFTRGNFSRRNMGGQV